MNANETPESLETLLAHALPAQSHTPVIIGKDFIPLVWVDGKTSPEAVLLQERLTTLGTYLAQVPEGPLEKVYGQVVTRWIYAYGSPSAFFLHVTIDAPSFTALTVVPPLRTEVTVRFSLNDATVRLLRTIADSRRVLLHFDAAPEWVRRHPLLQRSDRTRDMGKAGSTLVHSSLYLLFRPDLIARMAGQLDV